MKIKISDYKMTTRRGELYLTIPDNKFKIALKSNGGRPRKK